MLRSEMIKCPYTPELFQALLHYRTPTLTQYHSSHQPKVLFLQILSLSPIMAAIVNSDSIGAWCIEKFNVATLSNPTYLPRGRFPDLREPGRVAATIRGDRHFDSYSLDEVQRLIDYSLQNPKVFLTLAASELVCKIPILCSENFTDLHLPIRRQRNGTDFLVYSVAGRNGNHPWQCFNNNHWSWAQLTSFLLHQWLFQAIIFEDDSFVYEVSRDCPLPYTELEDADVASGHFGRVFRLRLLAEHIMSNFGSYLPHPQIVRPISFPTAILSRTKLKSSPRFLNIRRNLIS